MARSTSQPHTRLRDIEVPQLDLSGFGRTEMFLDRLRDENSALDRLRYELDVEDRLYAAQARFEPVC